MTASSITKIEEKLLETISDLEFLKEDLDKVSDINSMDAEDMILIEKIAESIKSRRSLIDSLLYKHGLRQDQD